MKILLLLAILTVNVFAHKPSDSYLRFNVAPNGTLSGQWDIALVDLEFAIGLDENQDNRITWGELKKQQRVVQDYALSALKLSQNGIPIPLTATDLLSDNHTDGGYAVIQFASSIPIQSPLTIHYSFLFDLDSQHRGLATIQYGDASPTTAIFSTDHRETTLTPNAPHPSAFQFIREGIVHIWQGADHLLFLLCLLLPAALAGTIRAASAPAFKVVTAFTLAHSITLALAGLNIIHPPSRLVESIIAASVAVAAINNIVPIFHHSAWRIAFLFGLVHGFGFASVLADLAPNRVPWRELLGFNFGVELGQLAFVAIFLPILILIQRLKAAQRYALCAGSAVIFLIACGWTVERAFGLRLF